MKFDNWLEMYNYVSDGKDLYNTKTGDYVFVYNDACALCTYHLSEEEAQDLARKNVEYDESGWSAFLGVGGYILDNCEYDKYRFSKDESKRSLYLKPSIDYCKDMYEKDGWEDTTCYEEVVMEKENNKEKITHDEIMEVLQKYDPSLYEYYQENGRAFGISTENYAAYLLDKYKEKEMER